MEKLLLWQQAGGLRHKTAEPIRENSFHSRKFVFPDFLHELEEWSRPPDYKHGRPKTIGLPEGETFSNRPML